MMVELHASGQRALTTTILLLGCLLCLNVFAQGNAPLVPVVTLILDDEKISCPKVDPTTVLTKESISVRTQSELDALAGVTRIEGSLRVLLSNNDLDFSPLDSLVEVSGEILISDNSAITTINGFHCLESAGRGLGILRNSSLLSINGFTKLQTVEVLRISANQRLLSTSGFQSLATIDLELTIQLNDELTQMPSFDRLTTIGAWGLLLQNNPKLLNFPSFRRLTSVGKGVKINMGLAQDLPGFRALTTVAGDFEIINLRELERITGFKSLMSSGVDGRVLVSNNRKLDCTRPLPSFVPVTLSELNLVDCPTAP